MQRAMWQFFRFYDTIACTGRCYPFGINKKINDGEQKKYIVVEKNNCRQTQNNYIPSAVQADTTQTRNTTGIALLDGTAHGSCPTAGSAAAAVRSHAAPRYPTGWSVTAVRRTGRLGRAAALGCLCTRRYILH